MPFLILLATVIGCSTILAGGNDPFRIDLSTALRLADAENNQIALAKERVKQAEAELSLSKLLLLPDLSAGASYNHHNGPLQETSGNILDVKRSSGYAGLGANAVGAGDVQISGIGLNVDLGDAFYAPLVANQNLLAVTAESEAVKNQMLLTVAGAYFELVRAQGNLEIAIEAHNNANDLAKTTKSFADTGQGLTSDSERTGVEALIRQRGISVARELLAVRSVELARLLRLKAGIQLRATSSPEARVKWVDASRGTDALIAEALNNRPEMKAGEAQLKGAEQSLNRTKLAPLFPKIIVGASYGAYGGGRGSSLSSGADRTDLSVGIYWTLEGLGFGQHARVKGRKSLREQARLMRVDLEDGVTAEVSMAMAAVTNRKSQIAALSEAVGRARRSYELNRTRVFENQGLPIETLQAIQSLATARTLHRDAVIDYNLAQFQLYTAIGQPAK